MREKEAIIVSVVPPVSFAWPGTGSSWLGCHKSQCKRNRDMDDSLTQWKQIEGLKFVLCCDS